MKEKLIIMDLDDTLIHTHMVYLAVTADFMDKMESIGAIDDNLYYTLDSFDQENVEAAGYFKQEAFPQAMLQTYAFYCEKLDLEYSEETAREIEEIGWQINEIRYLPVDGAKTLLDALADRHRVVLLTQGEDAIQRKKITDNSFQEHFEEIIVVPKKDITVFQDIISRYQASPKDTWIIGNSIRSEINHAIQLGVPCIHTKVTSSWGYEETKPQGNYFEVEQLIDCLDIIEKGVS